MPLYSYTALNAQGVRVHGTLNADSLNEAREVLKEQNVTPEEVFQISFDSSKKTSRIEIPTAEFPLEEPVQMTASEDPPNPPTTPTQSTENTWHLETEETVAEPQQPQEERAYYPFVDTLRLYAGWLLAWYVLVYALGYYQSHRTLSFEIPYLMGIYTSPLVLSFTLASFLFLLLTSLHRISGRGIFSGIFFALLGIGAFVLYRINV